ncbi:MAG TPA: efflux RND transporter periplasmic adaptor subunit [Pontiella sp.]
MKKTLLFISGLLMTLGVYAQEPPCDCDACREKAASGMQFTLPGLKGLERPVERPEAEPDETVPTADEGCGDCGHDHGEEHDELHNAVVQSSEDHDGHDGHEHGDCANGHDNEDEHAEGIALSDEMIRQAGIEIHTAVGGRISSSTVFPAEIKLNRDRSAAVSPRYDSIVRQVYAEIGSRVKKGDRLASLENRETMATYTVSAPLDGLVIARNVAVGEIARVDEVLFEVADLSSVWADISIFPQYQHLIREGLPVSFIAHDGHTAHGRLQYISPIISHETRTLTARCVLEQAGEDFMPGAFVRARISLRAAEVPVRVPRKAVQVLDGEAVVFVPGEHGFIPKVVLQGLADDQHVEIRHGLQPGDRYVAEGAFVLKAQTITGGMDPHAGHGH